MESPELVTDVPTTDYVTIPDTKVFRVDLKTKLDKDLSGFNVDQIPTKYIPISKLMEMTPAQIVDTIKYDLQSLQLEDNSKYNLDKVSRTVPSGRNENPEKSKYSIIGTQESNFFSNDFADGFTARQQLGDSKYVGDSAFGWQGKSNAAPAVNFIQDGNSKGFQTFTQMGKSTFV